MKNFDQAYKLLNGMFEDDYYPPSAVEKVKNLLTDVIHYLEQGTYTIEQVQEKLDIMTLGINELQQVFEAQDSEIETVARDYIAMDVEYILQWFGVEIDIEDAIGEREW